MNCSAGCSCNFVLVIDRSNTSRIREGWVTERSIVHAWKACVPQGTRGSNPLPSVSLVKTAREGERITFPHNNAGHVRLGSSLSAGGAAPLRSHGMFFRCRNDDASKESLFSGGW